MARKTFTWNNGSEAAPIVLTNEQLDKLIAIGRTENSDIEKNVSGHITTTTGNIYRFYYEILTSLYPNLNIHANIIEDIISVNISKNQLGENDFANIIVSGIHFDYLIFDLEHTITGIDGNISEENIKNRITIENNQLKVAAPQENASWIDRIDVYAYPIYDTKPTNPTFSIYVTAVKITSIDVSFPDEILSESTVDIPISYLPITNTKSNFVYKGESVSTGELNSMTRTYTAPNEEASGTYIGTFTIGNDTLNQIVVTKTFNIVLYKKSTITIDQRNNTILITGDTVIDSNTGNIKDGVTSDNNVIAWIRENSHLFVTRYNTTKNKLDIAQLYDGNKTRYDDNGNQGDSAPVSTLGNDVFLKLPEFYYKCVNAKDENNQDIIDVWDLSFANVRPTDSAGWNKWDDKWFIGVYEGFVNNNRLYSSSQIGSQATGNQNIGTFNNYVTNRNNDYNLSTNNIYSIISYSSHKIMALLYYAYYGNVDSQSQCGYGSDSYTRTIGVTNSLGKNDTTPSIASTLGSINFWGLENWWGDKVEWLTGVTTRDTSGMLTVIDSNLGIINPIKSNVAPNNTYCISKLWFNANADVIPTARIANTNYNTGFCDGSNVVASAGCVAVRSYSSIDPYGGVGCLGVTSAAPYAHASIGSRLEYHGDYDIVNKLD